MRPLLALIGLLIPLVGAAEAPQRQPCVVERISDGDTLRCKGLGPVRLLLVDAPESKQGAPGADAKRALQELAPVGTTVQLELDVQERDRYGRVLAYVFATDGRMVNEELARRGLVLALTYPPNVRHVERIAAAVAAAREASLGLWAAGALPCSPRDFRAGRCKSEPATPGRQRQ